MQSLQLKIPPVLVMLLAILLSYCSANYLPFSPLPKVMVDLFGFVIGLGILIIFLGVWQFRRARTTVDPTAPEKATELVSNGIYRFTRNPMYLGMLLMVIASVLKFGNAWAFIVVPFFMLYMTYFQIQPEEQAIEGIFGNEYLAYKTKVRRWL